MALAPYVNFLWNNCEGLFIYVPLLDFSKPNVETFPYGGGKHYWGCTDAKGICLEDVT